MVEPEFEAMWLRHDFTLDEVDDAVDWLRGLDRETFLFAPTLHDYQGRLGTFDHEHHFSPRTNWRSRPAIPSNIAMLCYVPDYPMLDEVAAIMRSVGGVLCVVESWTAPIRGWARGVGALDFRTGEPEPPFDKDTVSLIERLVAEGEIAYTTHADVTRRILARAHTDGLLTR